MVSCFSTISLTDSDSCAMSNVMTTDADGRRVRGPVKRYGKGVYWRSDRNCWTARITVGDRNIHLGNYDKESDALKARRTAEEKLKLDPNAFTLKSDPD
jgi:hypothetical protein